MQFIKLLLAFLLLSYPVMADNALIPIKFSGRYDFALSGIPFGRLDMQFTQDAASYSAAADISTVGIIKIFVDHNSHTTSSGQGQNFSYSTANYESRYSTRKKPKYVKMSAQDGVLHVDKLEPADDPKVRPPVASNALQGALDPLAFGLALRSTFAQALHDGRQAFSLNYYDGRRLTRVDLKVGPEKKIRISGNVYPVYNVTARRAAIAGYTQKELDRFDPDEPNLTIYFSQDEKFLPIRLEVPLMFGVASATLKM